jgi:hypothetical protein
MEARIKLEKVFSKMAKEIPLYAERFPLVNTPDEYYIIVAFIDLFEFIFRLYKTKMINEKLWFRWKALATAMNTMPKFAALWNRTKLKIMVFLIYGFFSLVSTPSSADYPFPFSSVRASALSCNSFLFSSPSSSFISESSLSIFSDIFRISN